MNAFFAKTAKAISAAVGSPVAFIVAALAVITWILSGPIFDFSETWQLVINTGTTIVTFLMVFIIQNAQNRDQKAIQLKLDELLRATSEAKTGFVNLENRDDKTLKDLDDRSRTLQERNAADVEDAVREGRHEADDGEGGAK